MATLASDGSEDQATLTVDLGPNIRVCRLERGMTLRELARRVGISSSALSQIEIGRAMPSVKTLYEIGRQLGTTPDRIFFGSGDSRLLSAGDRGLTGSAASDIAGVSNEAAVIQDNGLDAHLNGILELVPRAAQHVVTLKGGESLRQLGGSSLPGVDCVRIRYEPGAVSPGVDEFVRHAGHEFNYLLSGELVLVVGAKEHRLTAGDSMTFPSDWPHRVLNPSDEVADVLCLFVRGAGPSPARALSEVSAVGADPLASNLEKGRP